MNNIDKIRHELSKQEYGALLITDPVSRLYATGFQADSGVLFVTEHGAWFFTDSRFVEAAQIGVSGADVLLVTDENSYSDQIKAILNDNRLISLGFEDGSTSYASYLDWEDKLGVKLIPAQKLMNGLRAVKSADDLENLIKAERLAEKSFNEILPLVSTDITEKELAAELIYRLLKNGADDKSFDPIVVSGRKSSMPHGVPDNVKIGKGFLTIDFGARLNGWCSDTTRTLCVGKPDAGMLKVYDIVLRAQEAGINAARAGVEAVDVDAAARTIIETAGYGEFFGHGFGHGVGLEIHESPRVSKVSKETLCAGAVISAEPGIYIPGSYGVRIEDVLFITETGCENITNLTKELIVL